MVLGLALSINLAAAAPLRSGDRSTEQHVALQATTAGIQAGAAYSIGMAAPWVPPDPAYRISIPADAPANLNRTDGI